MYPNKPFAAIRGLPPLVTRPGPHPARSGTAGTLTVLARAGSQPLPLAKNDASTSYQARRTPGAERRDRDPDEGRRRHRTRSQGRQRAAGSGTVPLFDITAIQADTPGWP